MVNYVHNCPIWGEPHEASGLCAESVELPLLHFVCILAAFHRGVVLTCLSVIASYSGSLDTLTCSLRLRSDKAWLTSCSRFWSLSEST